MRHVCALATATILLAAMATACGGGEGDDDGDDVAPDVCGDGIVGATEACDTGIASGGAGACPMVAADCDDGDSCTTDAVDGIACQTTCTHETVTALLDGDGCCPSVTDATSYYDFDCPAMCGNGLVEMGETCDTAVAPGEIGACPMMSGDCDDGYACTDDAVSGTSCTTECTWTERTTVMASDGCCPAGATGATDNDCVAAPTCGNGVFNPGVGELCDPAIAAGNPGACPTSCMSEDACTNTMLLSAGTCKAQCTDHPVRFPKNGDMCCPVFYGGNNRNDMECTTSCGTPAEECTTPGMGDCDPDCRIVRTAYRMISISIMDPHVFFRNGNVCADLTTIANTSVIPDAMEQDADGDGWADLTIMLAMRPLDQSGSSTPMDLVFGECTPSMNPAVTTCESVPTTGRIVSMANNMATGTCLDVVPNTLTDAYMTPPVVPVAGMQPCLVSDVFNGTFKLGSLSVPLADAHVAAVYDADPADNLIDGLVVGFVSESAAMAAVIPDTVPLIGGNALYDILAGGIPPGACTVSGAGAIGDDRDVGPDGTTPGWWFYVNFTAVKVPYVDKPTDGS